MSTNYIFKKKIPLSEFKKLKEKYGITLHKKRNGAYYIENDKNYLFLDTYEPDIVYGFTRYAGSGDVSKLVHILWEHFDIPIATEYDADENGKIDWSLVNKEDI